MKEEFWKVSERKVREALRPYFKTMATPGSGNKGLKSDVLLCDSDIAVEVKSTINTDHFTIESKWFVKLLGYYYGKKTPMFAFTWWPDGMVFYCLEDYTFITSREEQWKTLKVKGDPLSTDDFPDTIIIDLLQNKLFAHKMRFVFKKVTNAAETKNYEP